jgi:hypothetical protein
MNCCSRCADARRVGSGVSGQRHFTPARARLSMRPRFLVAWIPCQLS